eukprot:TRINITY_DN17313_c0_g1_i16.p1 TRINITY_DN17313_c0_g1~~TRINITY_DN17313_c0_g1_i16.p1  ORF type:complete len:247 (+),score=67.27 TRINITY_DN17313_c0_g1_i16:629-1369(+)
MKIFKRGLPVPQVRDTLAAYAKSSTMEKFINALLSDVLTAFGDALEKLQVLHKADKNPSTKSREHTVQMCKISLRFGCRGFWVLETLCNHAKDAVLNQLFLPRIAKLVNMLSTSFYGKKAERYQVSNAEEVGLKLGKVLRGVVACSAGLCDSEEFVQEVAGGNEYLQLDALKRSARAARVLSASDYGCTCSCRNYSDCGVREANRKGGEGGGERGQHGGLHRGAGRVHRHAPVSYTHLTLPTNREV